ncbi:MAG: hypothetical protein KKH28_12310 [Elusimicrobia bacterium]|nr:hypothetical protein [Elusimicrobiota bacterium]
MNNDFNCNFRVDSGQVKYRPAGKEDIPALLKLSRLAEANGSAPLNDSFAGPRPFEALAKKDGSPAPHNPQKILEEMQSENSILFAAEKGKDLVAVIFVLSERNHGLCKIYRMYADAGAEGAREILKKLLLFAMDHLQNSAFRPDVLYTTTRTLTLKQQEFTLDLGFKLLGIFPNVPGQAPSGFNGLTARYFNNALADKRYTDFSLHPAIAPFYEITRKECGLGKLPVSPPAAPAEDRNRTTLPVLEALQAPGFVARRFDMLKERKFLSINFYPFQKPNILITSPDQGIEMFVKAVQEPRFAAIVAEKLDVAVDPVQLYKAVALILRGLNISYIEVINDAADAAGINDILNAGYLPCAYFPALKRQGNARRDFVIFSKSFERIFQPFSGDVNETYKQYLKAYLSLSAKHSGGSPPIQPGGHSAV